MDEITLSSLECKTYRDNALCNKLHTLYPSDRRNSAALIVENDLERLSEDMMPARCAVVPPHTICFPLLPKKSPIISPSLSGDEGGPIIILTLFFTASP